MEPSRTFVIGDIHGAFRALQQCFERAEFDNDNDMLICLGDVCDSWPEVDKVIDKLLGVKTFVLIEGNHDQWALDWFISGTAQSIWTNQGGDATITSYKEKEIPAAHIEFLQSALPYFVSGNKLFVHGGIIPGIPLEKQDRGIFAWDRSLISSAMILKDSGRERNLTGYDEVYIGHTPTLKYGEKVPVKACEIYMMDTGAGWPDGVLTIMDTNAKETYKSDIMSRIYKGIKGRD